MPEYLAPDVYVVEVDATPQPIQGIPTSTIDLVISAIVQDVRKQLGMAVPDWTEHNSTDPGVTADRTVRLACRGNNLSRQQNPRSRSRPGSV